MAHFSRIEKIVIDAAPEDHERELAFWQGASGHTFKHFKKYPEYHWTSLSNPKIGLLMQRLDEGASRVHLDIHTTDIEAEVARLESLGAKRLHEAHEWWIMEDPAGLPFCVIHDSKLDETNSNRWE